MKGKRRETYYECLTGKNNEELETFSTVDHKAYVYYRENSKLANRELVAHFVEYGKIMNCLYGLIEDEISNNLAGFFFKNLGYFGLSKNFSVPLLNTKERTILRKASKMNLDDKYFIVYVPITKKRVDRIYSMDLSATTTLKNKVKKKLKEGWGYMFSPSIFLNNLRNE